MAQKVLTRYFNCFLICCLLSLTETVRAAVSGDEFCKVVNTNDEVVSPMISINSDYSQANTVQVSEKTFFINEVK